jgi:DNA ligase-associated metallophosphoesterase
MSNGHSQPTFLVQGETIVPDSSGAIFLPAWSTLVVADLHLEKGSSYLARGVPLPPFDSGETLRRLETAVSHFKPKRIIALGDSFHDKGGDLRLGEGEGQILSRLVQAHDWIWIIGNHDPAPRASLGGSIAESLPLGALTLTHEPSARAPGQVAGHLHPVAKVIAGGRALRRRCFVSDGAQLILPAFGAYAGGLNVLDPAFAPILSRRFHAWMIGADGIYKVAADRLAPDVRAVAG